MTETQPRFTPNQKVTWLQPLGGRRNLRNNFCAGLSLSVKAVVVSVGPKLVTIQVEGEDETRRVKARNLRNLRIESEVV